MKVDLSDTLERIIQLERELEQEFKKKNHEIIQSYQQQKVRLATSIRKQQEKYKVNLAKYVFGPRLLSVLVTPIIYSMLVPIAFYDLSLFIYQHITFRVYRIPVVKREDYFVIDRHHLGYLNILEKVNCVYCGYGNAVATYGKEIIARTEQYWCPIKHASRVKDPHTRYFNYFEYGDAEGYRDNLADVIRKYDEIN
jgi:hypothetical protein